MDLVITTPLGVVIRAEGVTHVRAEDATGAFGILRGHADFLTALVPSVVSWRSTNQPERHCAVRGGVLTVTGGQHVAVATREAVPGAELMRLEHDVIERFRRERAEEEEARTAAQRLHLAALRRVITYLRPRRQGLPLHREPTADIEGDS